MNKPHVTLDNTIHIYYTWGQIRSIHYFNVCIIGNQAIINVHVYVIVRSRIRAVYRKYTRTFVYSSGFPNKPDSIRDLTILYHHVRVQFEFGLYATIQYTIASGATAS